MPARGLRSVINLLPKSEFEMSFWGRVLAWALTTGRYIIILTELVVILAFVSRFKLDKDLADLGDSIGGKKAILEALAATEKNFRTVQNKLTTIRGYLDSQTPMRNLLDHTMTHIPTNMSVQDLSITKTGITLTGQAPDRQTLGEFLQRMGEDKIWKSLELSSLTAEKTTLKFIFKANI